MAGINRSGQRPKTAKNLRRATTKKFKGNSEEAKAKYAAKMASRASRKLKKNRK